MSIYEHSRHKIFNPAQHPLSHGIDDLVFTDARLPGISRLSDVISFIVSSMFPNFIGAFATPAALPVSANKNDYAVVNDDGDGKAAGYVWIVVDNAGQWVKRYDMDWSVEGLASDVLSRAGYIFVSKDGRDDTDGTGSPVAGALAGQTLFGGASANTNLTLFANAGDSAGGNTGAIQIGDEIRPLLDGSTKLGTTGRRWSELHAQEGIFDTLTVSAASIQDSNGSISFSDNDLSTTGVISAGSLEVETSVAIGTAGTISDNAGSLDFNSADVQGVDTLSAVTADLGSANIGDLTIVGDEISSGTGGLSFDGADMTQINSAQIGSAQIAGIQINGTGITAPVGSTVLVINSEIQAPEGSIDAISAQTIQASTSVSTDSISSMTTTPLEIDGAAGINMDAGGILNLTASDVIPYGSPALGEPAHRFSDLYLSGEIDVAGTNLSTATLQSLSSVTSGASSGMSLFYDAGTGKFLPSFPDSEVDHASIANITTGDGGHTQFAMLAGRSGGQTVHGGTAASENLVLESTSHATKGSVVSKDPIVPDSTAAYTTSWQGTDLGSSTKVWRDLYTAGEAKGLRLENLSAAPSSSPTKPGRLYYNTTSQTISVDTGSSWASISNPGSVASISSSTTLSGSEYVVLVNAASGAITVTLPAHTVGKTINIKKTDSSLNEVTISPPSGTIDGAATKKLKFQYDSVTLVSDGTNIFLI